MGGSTLQGTTKLLPKQKLRMAFQYHHYYYFNPELRKSDFLPLLLPLQGAKAIHKREHRMGTMAYMQETDLREDPA